MSNPDDFKPSSERRMPEEGAISPYRVDAGAVQSKTSDVPAQSPGWRLGDNWRDVSHAITKGRVGQVIVQGHAAGKWLLTRLSFWTFVAISGILGTIYYFVFADTHYDAQVVLTIRNELPSASAATSFLGAMLGSSGNVSDYNALSSYLQSADMMHWMDGQFHLHQLYSAPERNPFWRLGFLWNFDNDENFLNFFDDNFIVSVQSDLGLITVDVLDVDPKRSYAMSQKVVERAQWFIRQQQANMQTAMLGFARQQLKDAVASVAAASTPTAQQVAEIELQSAQSALANAEAQVNSQSEFAEVVNGPMYPTSTLYPERFLDIGFVMTAAAMIYVIFYLLWSNVRDHRGH